MTRDQMAALLVEKGKAPDLAAAYGQVDEYIERKNLQPVKEAAPPPSPPSQPKVARQPTGGSKGTTTRATRPPGTAPAVKEPEVFLGPVEEPDLTGGFAFKPPPSAADVVSMARQVAGAKLADMRQMASEKLAGYQSIPGVPPPSRNDVSLPRSPPSRVADYAPADAVGWQPGPGSEAAEAAAARAELVREGVITPEMAAQLGSDADAIRFYNRPAVQKALGSE